MRGEASFEDMGKLFNRSEGLSVVSVSEFEFRGLSLPTEDKSLVQLQAADNAGISSLHSPPVPLSL